MTILIGLNGFKRSGKNTAAQFIKNWGENRHLSVGIRAFAELLKLSAARSLGLATNLNDAVVLMDAFKENGDLLITIPGQTILREITGREFLKWYGTEAHRDVFGQDFWVDQILPLPGGRSFPWHYNFATEDDAVPDIAVITDCRFANEAVRIKKLGGVVWSIDRGNWDQDSHISEQPLPKHLIDLTIHNRSTLEAFEVNVNSEMTANFHMRFVEQID